MARAGRPPGPTSETEATVLTTALELLLTEGPGALSAQRVHQVSGVSRSTIYRHWPTPRDLLQALIRVSQEPDMPLTDDMQKNLHAAVDLLCDRIQKKPVAQFLRALGSLSDPADGEEISNELQLEYVESLNAPFRQALHAGAVTSQSMHDLVAAIVSPLLIDAMLLGTSIEVSRARAHRQVKREMQHLEIDAITTT